MFFSNSRPDRHKRALRLNPELRPKVTRAATIPPAKPYELLTEEEIYLGSDRTLMFDIESYPNYFLIAFKCWQTKKVIVFEDTPTDYINIDLLGFVLHRFLCVGFNSRNFDIILCAMALAGYRAPELFEATTKLIGGVRPYEIHKEYGVRELKTNHIDIIEVCPLQASLKLYAGRIHCERMQDLPYAIGRDLEPHEAFNVRGYCINDLDNTGLLYDFQKPHIELREDIGRTYSEDVRSKSDAQLAEVIISGELAKIGIKAKLPDITPGFSFRYRVPAHIQFKTPQLQAMLELVRSLDFEVDLNGYVDAPAAMSALRISMGRCVYQMGMGGLHSTEESVSYVADAGTMIIDRDVEGYYPQIILNEQLYPPHLGPGFLTVFGGMKLRRSQAKKDPERQKEAGGLKIANNGTFGKTGNQFSIVYSPENLVQICLSGQLNLLMLIESIELIGIPVVSGNTDGIVILCPHDRYDDLTKIIILWEEITGFTTEETRYRSIHSRDINNYIAVKEDGSCKTKGVYCENGSAQGSPLSKNPESQICSDAVQAFLSAGVPVERTIRECQDVRRFVSVRTVNGGAQKDGQYLGKAIRWYYATDEVGAIHRVLTGHMVPKTEGAKPCMDLPDSVPADLDYDYYIRVANDMLYDLGVYRRAAQQRLL